MAEPARIRFLDDYRALGVFLVVVVHASMGYMAFAPSWFPVTEADSSLFFSLVVAVLEAPLIQVFFFISGYFALGSLERYGAAGFLKGKTIRIGIPWVLAVLLLAPPTAYIALYTRSVPTTLLEFWVGDFWGPYYQQSAYWYLGVVYLFFGVLAGAHALGYRIREHTADRRRPGFTAFFLFWAVTAFGYLALNLLWPIGSWIHPAYVLVFQPLRVPMYIGYFLMGMHARRRGWFTPEGYRPRASVWWPLWGAAASLYLLLQLLVFVFEVGTPPLAHVAHAWLFSLLALTTVIGGAVLSQKTWGRGGRFMTSQSRNAYGIYFVHPLVLYPLAMVFSDLPVSIFIKAPVLIVLTMALCWLLTEYVLRRAPLLRRVF